MMGQRDWLFQTEARRPKDVGETLSRFWRYFQRYSYVLISVAVLVIVSTYVQVAVPNLIGQAVDCYLAPATPTSIATTSEAHCWLTTLPPNAGPQDYVRGLGTLVLLISALYVASSLLTGLQFYLMTFMGQNVLRSLRSDAFA